jgi:septum formation topological specificity factor MinE
VGLFDFFRNRRQRESALPQAESELGTFAQPQGQEVVGQQAGAAPGVSGDQVDLSQLGSIIQSAIEHGNVTIDQGPSQTIDMRGTGLREEILGIMQQHGLNPEGGASMNVNAGDYGDMQKQIMEALSKHGVNIDGGHVQVDPSAEDK